MTGVVDHVDGAVLAARAEAAALTGDLDGALLLADQALVEGAAHGAAVSAAVLAQRGMLADSAALYQWSHSMGAAPSGFAVTALIGTGALAEGQSVLAELDADRSHAPTLMARTQSLMAHGVHDSVTGSPVAALSQLIHAAALLEPREGTVLLPDTPGALACLVATQLGELDVAEAAVSAPGSTRHRLLRSWIALLRGDLTAVDQDVAALEPRDELFAAALEIGLARRQSDLSVMMDAWPRARDAVIAHPVDLFVLQPLGEIAVAAARLGEGAWLAPQLTAAEALLDRLGRPALWSAPLHWYGVQAAIAAESPPAAARHAAELVSLACTSRYAAALAGCARSWLQVLAGKIDTPSVIRAARAMQAVGLGWDGARLAGQAAIRTPDRRDMSTLLTCARALHAIPHVAESPAPQLSGREIEVAELLVAGMTYKQIGERLFISAKTVEHHIARIRQRLGSASREELFSQLRSVVGQAAKNI